jgi:hypothetical protein
MAYDPEATWKAESIRFMFNVITALISAVFVRYLTYYFDQLATARDNIKNEAAEARTTAANDAAAAREQQNRTAAKALEKIRLDGEVSNKKFETVYREKLKLSRELAIKKLETESTRSPAFKKSSGVSLSFDDAGVSSFDNAAKAAITAMNQAVVDAEVHFDTARTDIAALFPDPAGGAGGRR